MPRGRVAGIALALLVATAACAAPASKASAAAYFYRVPPSDAAAGSVEGLIPVARSVAARTAAEAIAALLAGPTTEERTAGISTAIPDGTALLGVTVASGVATVNLSASYDDGGGSMSMFVRLDQLVYTVTQFPEITGVNLQLDGAPVTTFSSEGLELPVPLRRDDSYDQLPAIFIDSPAWGGTLANPAHVHGLSNVFEAQFKIELDDASGALLAGVVAMASCGTGCWGTFESEIPYTVSEPQWGTLRAYEPSAKDGTPVNVVEYRVRLVPRAGN